MEIKQINELCKERVPKICPFCDLSGFQWCEFKVHVADIYYFDQELRTPLGRRPSSQELTVFCTRCEEQIRPEDV